MHDALALHAQSVTHACMPCALWTTTCHPLHSAHSVRHTLAHLGKMFPPFRCVVRSLIDS